MVKSFDSQSLRNIPPMDKNETKPYDTQSLNPRILMEMTTIENLNLQHQQSYASLKPKYIETIISVSKVKEETTDNHLSESTATPQTKDSGTSFECAPERSANAGTSTVISESLIYNSSSDKDSKDFLTANNNSGILQDYGNFVDIPLSSGQRERIQIVPLNAFLHIPQDTQFIISNHAGSQINICHRPDTGFGRSQLDTNVESRGSDTLKRITASNFSFPQQNKAKYQVERPVQPQVLEVNQRVSGRGERSPNTNERLKINTQREKIPHLAESSVTLYESVSCEDVLMENSNSYKDTSLNDALLNSLNGQDKTKFQNQTKEGLLARKIFRIVNFIRAIATAIYAFVVSSKQLENENIIALGAKNILIASIFFAALDVVIAFIRLFPQYFWCFWDVKNWDPVFLIF